MSIHRKINEVMLKVHGVEKTSVNKAKGNYKFAGHEAVNAALREHFAAVGIVRQASIVRLDVLEGTNVGTLVAHCIVRYTDVSDDSFIEVPMVAVQPAQTSARTLEAQQVGQCLSYAVKNVEFKLFALTGDNEPDSDTTHGERESLQPTDGADAPTERAGLLLSTFAACATIEQVMSVNDTLKKEWPALKTVPGLAERIVQHKTAAIARIKATPADPEQDGR